MAVIDHKAMEREKAYERKYKQVLLSLRWLSNIFYADISAHVSMHDALARLQIQIEREKDRNW